MLSDTENLEIYVDCDRSTSNNSAPDGILLFYPSRSKYLILKISCVIFVCSHSSNLLSQPFVVFFIALSKTKRLLSDIETRCLVSSLNGSKDL